MPKAVEYILQHFDQIPNTDELLQMSIIEVIKLDCKQDTIHRVCRPNVPVMHVLTVRRQPRFILLISELLNSSSHAVKYEAAGILTSLTQNPAAIKGQSTLLFHHSLA
jgi:coatomer subunit beta